MLLTYLVLDVLVNLSNALMYLASTKELRINMASLKWRDPDRAVESNFIFLFNCHAMPCKHGLSRRAVSVCLSVCLCVSVTFVHSVKTNKHIFKIFSPSDRATYAILVFHAKRHGNIPTWTT